MLRNLQDGLWGTWYWLWRLSHTLAAQMRLLQGIKATFDPKGLLNPGKVVS